MCADVYLFLKGFLGSECTVPEDAPDIPEFQLVDMFTSVTDSGHKSQIIRVFKQPGSLRVVIATIALVWGWIVLTSNKLCTLDCLLMYATIYKKLEGLP